jgi:predicted esterase YcpF (UPF0227 family)
MSTRILFIHGFGSCGNGAKSAVLRAYFRNDTLLAPDLETNPSRAIRTLEQILACEPVDLLIGASLGGFFAVWLNRTHPLPTVLINPAMQPWETLAPFIGVNRHWCTGEAYELTREHLRMLGAMTRTPDPALEHYLVLLARHDELLDYSDAARRFAAFDVRIDDTDDHRFCRLAHYLPDIARFRERAGSRSYTPS